MYRIKLKLQEQCKGRKNPLDPCSFLASIHLFPPPAFYLLGQIPHYSCDRDRHVFHHGTGGSSEDEVEVGGVFFFFFIQYNKQVSKQREKERAGRGVGGVEKIERIIHGVDEGHRRCREGGWRIKKLFLVLHKQGKDENGSKSVIYISWKLLPDCLLSL